MIFRLILPILALMCAFPAVLHARDVSPLAAPESATGLNTLSIARGTNFMAVTAHPDATKAAHDILAAGGTAADAGIAAQLMLGLVEPQSSGIGGGSFALYYNAEFQNLFSLDGRETAPDNAGLNLFTRENGKPMSFYEAGNGGRAVGVPGTLRLLEKLYRWESKTPWADLFQPAIAKARDGFTVTSRMHQMLKKEAKRFDVDTEAKLYFYPDTATPVQAGKLKDNQKYADLLQAIADNGADYFYTDQPAKNIVEKVRGSKGLLSIEDMTEYKVKEREPVCGDYRGYKVCSMGQSSSGGLTLLMILGMLEQFDLPSWGAYSTQSWHVIAETSRLAFADRNLYMADEDFAVTPNLRLLDKGYLSSRASLINTTAPLKTASAGIPPDWPPEQENTEDDDLNKPPGTTNISIVDMYGNILSMTSSIQNAFGSRVMVDGYLLNNELTDFAFDPMDDQGRMKLNRVEGGKRPRSSMSPTIIFDPQGRPFMVIGSAGGSRIIGYVLQRIISAIDWNMPVEQSIKAPHIVHRGKKLELESIGMEKAESFKSFGHPVVVGEMNSGLTAIQFDGAQMTGVADPRRDGVAMGE